MRWMTATAVRGSVGGAFVVAVALSCVVSATQAQGRLRPQTTSPYMRVCGLEFCIGSSAFYPYGATMYESTKQAGITNPSGSIALARSQHLNTIRLANFLDHDGNPATAPYDPASWRQVDIFVADAEAAGIRVLLDLSDYKAELWNACINPYTARWTRYLSFVAKRVSTVTHLQYRADPGIVMVSFTGEPLPVGSHTFTDEAGRPCTISYTSSTLTDFYAHAERTWQRMDHHHLTTAGGLSYVDQPNSGINWQAIFANRHNSVCAWKTYGNMVNWVATGASYCRRVLHKPWFNDEWGYLQSVGDSARATAFEAQFQNNLRNGAAGNFYWNANYELASTTYDVGPQTPATQAVVIGNAP